MLPVSMNWLRNLPEEVRRLALVKEYARIANVLALDWNKPIACIAYLNSLLVNHRRGKRQGLPLDVHRKLQTLRDYYHHGHPTPGRVIITEVLARLQGQLRLRLRPQAPELPQLEAISTLGTDSSLRKDIRINPESMRAGRNQLS